MKFSGNVFQDNGLRLGFTPHELQPVLLFDNLNVKLTNETDERTASQVHVFTFPVIVEENDQQTEVTVILSGLTFLDKGIRATLFVSLGDRAVTFDLTPGTLVEQPPVVNGGQVQAPEEQGEQRFERQLTATLPMGAKDILVTLFLLIERTQKNMTAWGRVDIDNLVLALPSANGYNSKPLS